MANGDEDEPAAGQPTSGPQGPVGQPPSGQPPSGQPPPPPGWGPVYLPGPPPVPPADRVLAACWRRAETDYIFDYWSALGWSILTLGIFGFYVFYQLVRRMRDHNVRRLELFDAALVFAWEEAGRRGLQEELTPSFQRASAHMDVLRRMTTEFRDPVVWLVISILARGLVDLVAFILLDQDLGKHDRAEVGVEYELSLLYGRFGVFVPAPDQQRVKGQDNYAGRVVATIFSFGIYLLWWYYDQMVVPNRHFLVNWPQEDALAAAVTALR